jgi:hypothetical protein
VNFVVFGVALGAALAHAEAPTIVATQMSPNAVSVFIAVLSSLTGIGAVAGMKLVAPRARRLCAPLPSESASTKKAEHGQHDDDDDDDPED